MTSNRQTVKSMPEWFFALVTGAIAFGLTVLFFRNSWWGPDDGIYALVADQMLKGKILFKDIQEIHPGYIDFTNAAVMKLFGRDILVLRYPLLLLFTIEAVLAYFLLKKSYPKSVAILCALIFPLLSYALFNNITANWYAQFLAFILGGVFAGVIPVNRHRTLIIGIIVGLAIMFRQTTGVFIGFAALFLLILENSNSEKSASRFFSRAVITVLTLGFAAYLAIAAQQPGFFLFGIWPLLLLALGVTKANTTPENTIKIIAQLSAGVALATAPLVLYNIYHGSFLIWLNDITLALMRMRQSVHFESANYFDISTLTVWAITQKPFLGALGAIFWNLLLTSGAILGIGLLSRLKRGVFDNATKFGVVASFHGVVGLHYEVAIYLIYVCGLCWLAILLLLDFNREKRIFIGLTVFLLSFSFLFHSGESVTRGFAKMALAEKTSFIPLEIEGASINVDPVEKELYHSLLSVIQNCSTDEDKVFFFPTNAELYFLSQRDLPFRFYATSVGIQTSEALSSTMAAFEGENGVALFIDKHNDKYHNEFSLFLAEFIDKNYYFLSSAFGFRVYTKDVVEPNSDCAKAGRSLGALSPKM